MKPNKIINWAGVLVFKNKKILTLKELDKDFYLLPGGKMEPGETPEQTILREVDEELAISVNKLEKYIKVDEAAKNNEGTIHFILYRGQIDSEPSRGAMPQRTESIAWIDSKYASQVPDIGNLLKYHVIPQLKQKGLIN